MGRLYIHLHEQLMFNDFYGINVGKYIGPMDPMAWGVVFFDIIRRITVISEPNLSAGRSARSQVVQVSRPNDPPEKQHQCPPSDICFPLESQCFNKHTT